ncbi:DUF58 domain-containing protein [uncultured Chitinophaga sp.]|uniref:DUF58 domain-containing protein n=1 Tax=uncultured Chitinophaga sp. TaxID=339340 RepID=UPI0025E947DA|nr:DUF58 domain-containing protein [uncultured Chitinophaga sp.]
MSRLLDPKVLLSVKDLRLAAKTMVDGLLAGMHPGKLKGSGMEFSQYRSYQPGDDLRSLDWKMYARSDRYYIRESEMETGITVRFLVDASNSMAHTDDGISKMEYARYLTASLGYLAHLQGDATGLGVLSQGQLFSLAARKESQHMARFYYQLEQMQPGGTFTGPQQYRDLFSGAHTRQLTVFVSDFYQHGEITALLDTLSAMRHELIVFHLTARNELEKNYEGYTAVEDLETGEVVEIDNRNDAGYKERLRQWLAGIQRQMLDKHIYYRQIVINEPLDQALRDFLNQRNKVR